MMATTGAIWRERLPVEVPKGECTMSRAGMAPSPRAAAGTEPMETRPRQLENNPARVESLDVFRGFTMLWIIGGTPLVAGLLRVLGDNSVVNALTGQLQHTEWVGLRYWDLIWPSFMLAVGISLPYSHARRSQTRSDGPMFRDALRRAVILFLLGSLRTSVSLNQPTLIELSSALQPIAVAYLIGFLIVSWPSRALAGAAVGILAVHAAALAFAPAPGIAAGSYEPLKNVVTWVDLAVLGRAEPGGWGTILTTIPPAATTVVGILIGKLLMSSRTAGAKMRLMAATGIGCVAAGWAAGFVIPVIMKLWTSSYALVATGWSCLLFLGCYWLVDVHGYRKPAFFFSVIGANAIAIYLGKSLFRISAIVGIFSKPLAAYTGPFAPAFTAASVLAAEWLVLYWMYKRKIFLKA